MRSRHFGKSSYKGNRVGMIHTRYVGDTRKIPGIRFFGKPEGKSLNFVFLVYLCVVRTSREVEYLHDIV